MKEFIDKTDTVSGTKINRANLMAMQGFQATEISFDNETGEIFETNGDGEILTTVFNDDNTITEVFMGRLTMIKKTTFLPNGNIKMEVISQ